MLEHETAGSISRWAEATFGTAGSNARTAARANEELAELITALTIDDCHTKAAEEAADVCIVLARLADRIGVDFESAVNSPGSEFLPPNSNAGLTAVAQQAMGLALVKLCADKDHPGAVQTVTRIVQLLALLVHRLGSDLVNEVDRKMAVNRARIWRRDGTGHGYHIEPDRNSPAADTSASKSV